MGQRDRVFGRVYPAMKVDVVDSVFISELIFDVLAQNFACADLVALIIINHKRFFVSCDHPDFNVIGLAFKVIERSFLEDALWDSTCLIVFVHVGIRDVGIKSQKFKL